jgi:hypothetical protein
MSSSQLKYAIAALLNNTSMRLEQIVKLQIGDDGVVDVENQP